MNGQEQGLASLAVLVGIALRYLLNRGTREWLRRKPTDWNAVREQLGYDPAPDRPLRDLPTPRPRKLFGFWPLATDWDRVRREYGYGVTVEDTFAHHRHATEHSRHHVPLV